MKNIFLIIGLLFSIILVTFVLQNVISVDLHFAFWDLQNVPITLLILLCILFGVLIHWILSFWDKQKIKRELKKVKKSFSLLEKEKIALQSEIDQLKSRPLIEENCEETPSIESKSLSKNKDKGDSIEGSLLSDM